jgi:hypothetical protein
MRGIPSSPRARRRLIRLGIVLAVAGIVAAIFALVHGGKTPNAAPPKNAQRAQVNHQSKHVSPADRRAIDQTLDRFIPAGLSGSAPATAWRLSGPDLKGGSTLRQWRHGNSSIPYYPARGKTFHHWSVVDAGPSHVDFNLLVHPQAGHGAKGSSEVFSGEMIKRDGQWLVNGLYTIAVFARPDKHGRHELGPADFAAGQGAPQSSQSGAPPPSGHTASLSTTWLLVAAGVIVLVLLFPVGFGVASVLRSRRARRNYERAEARALAPFPRSVQGPTE